MPNGGITPDCFHCKWCTGHPFTTEAPYCTYHKINLPVPIRAFCSSFTDAEPSGTDWLDQMLDRSKLQNDHMYIWLGGYEVSFHHVPLVAVTEYGAWTREKFFDELEKLTSE